MSSRTLAGSIEREASIVSPERGEPVRVLIADHHEVFRVGLRNLLNGQKDILVVGEAADGEEAVERIVELSPDVVLMDVLMPRLDGLETLRRLRELGSATKVILLTANPRDDYIVHGLRAGAQGYLLKEARAEELFNAVRMVGVGGSSLDPSVAARLVTLMDASRGTALTEREMQVLQLVSSGARNKEIAGQLSLSVNTVKFHIENIYAKLGVDTRTQAARVGRERGLLAP